MSENNLRKPLSLVVRREQIDPEDTIVAYACAICGRVHHFEEEALKCHAPAYCIRCESVQVTGYSKFCPDCQYDMDLERETARFEKAEKLARENYSGPVYCDDFEYGGDWGDGFWSSLDAVLEWVIDDQESYDEALTEAKAKNDIKKINELGDRIEMPAYVYACIPYEFAIDADEIVESALEDHCESAVDKLSNKAVEELQTFLDEWCKKQDIVTYKCDDKRVILIPTKESSHDDTETDLGKNSLIC